MNERIRELVDQAAWKTRMTHNNAYWRMQEELAEDITWREKFAELIVQDCKNIIRQEWFKENNSEVDRQDTRSIAIHVGKKLGIDASLNAVTKHFGVEYE